MNGNASALARVSWGALAAVGAAALGLRLVGLDHLPGINGDEGVYAVHALSFLHGEPLGSLRTGTNLPMNPPFFGVVVLLHTVLEPSLFTLRLAAFVHSLLAVGLAFVLFRKRGSQFAVALGLLLAALPIQLGYARLAWDSTAVPTVVVLALAAATRLRPLLTLAAFALCLWVHPVTVFVLPILLAPFAAAHWPRTPEGRLGRPSRRALTFAGVGALALVAVALTLLTSDLLPAPVQRALHGELPGRIWHRLLSPGDALSFAQLYAELIAGPTIYRYLTGSVPAGIGWLHTLGFAAAFLFALHVLLRREREPARTIDAAVALGLLMSLAFTYVIGGLAILRPHTERYGMFLTVPSCYVLAAAFDALSSGELRAARLRLGLALLTGLLLVSFQVHALQALTRPNPLRANAFRTGDVDPKAQALAAILQGRDRSMTTVVLVEDWWIYWPVRYLAGPKPLALSIAGMPPDYRFPRDFKLPRVHPQKLELFAIAWAGGLFDRSLAARSLEHVDISGYEPGPILRVHRLRIR